MKELLKENDLLDDIFFRWTDARGKVNEYPQNLPLTKENAKKLGSIFLQSGNVFVHCQAYALNPYLITVPKLIKNSKPPLIKWYWHYGLNKLREDWIKASCPRVWPPNSQISRWDVIKKTLQKLWIRTTQYFDEIIEWIRFYFPNL